MELRTEIKLTRALERRLAERVQNWQKEVHRQVDPTCADVLNIICYSGKVDDMKITIGPAGLRFLPRCFNYAIVIERGEERLYAKSRWGRLYADVRDRFSVQELN